MQAHRPTTRVLAVLELLQTHGRMSGTELAKRLEIDGRTLRRYIVMLEELGIPIYAERGRHGAYSLVAGFKLPPLIFSEDEALALSLGLLAARHLGLADAALAIESAQAKLERVMPAALRQRVGAINGAVALDLPNAAARGNNAALIALSEATARQRSVWLRYASASDTISERDIDPYGVAFHGGCWYVIGHCHGRGALRSFRLDRIRALRVLDTVFERPVGFDAVRYLQDAVATLPRAYTVEVLLKTDLKTAQRRLQPWLGALETVEKGVVLRSQSDELEWFARVLAGMDFEFEILRPDALRAVVKEWAERLLGLADGGPQV